MSQLPIENVRMEFMRAIDAGNVVITATTGSGKSTRVPVWCATRGRVLVIEPRRVACRSLAARVADTEGSTLGDQVGYVVRDDANAHHRTGILFVTPGIAIRMLQEDDALSEYATVIIDEFHERTLDIDLICAAVKTSRKVGIVIMSATIEGDRIGDYLGGTHIQCFGRVFDVERRYLNRSADLPNSRDIVERLLSVADVIRTCPGNVLVFLPGKWEISSALESLRRVDGLDTFDFLTLHGGLSMSEQGRVFEVGPQRKLILCTNVAETSITVPDVRLVVDSGLVRQTQYRAGRGFLTLTAIAEDSAEQRTGRAGRLSAGQCMRLWGSAAKLQSRTRPEIKRESLVPFVFGCAALGLDPFAAPLLDPPPEHAVESAYSELRALGTIDDEGVLTPSGRLIYGLPLDVALGSMLVASQRHECVGDMIDLVAALAISRPLFLRSSSNNDLQERLKGRGCDVLALIGAVRHGVASSDGLSHVALREARFIATRLRKAFDQEQGAEKARPIDRRRLCRALLSSDRRSAYVARKRKREVAWSNGGTEASLSNESAIYFNQGESDYRLPETLIALETRATADGALRGRVVITTAMPVPKRWLIEAKVGRVKVVSVRLAKSSLVVEKTRSHAGKIIDSWTQVPSGPYAVESFALAILNGVIWRDLLAEVVTRLQRWAILAQIEENLVHELPLLDVREYLLQRAGELGVDSGSDFALLTAEDFLPADIPEHYHSRMARDFPRRLDYPDVSYNVRYDIQKKAVFLVKERGSRQSPPPLMWLPKFNGLSIFLVDKRGEHKLRGRSF
jgi:ATP-dependent helicase HrpB